MRGRCDRHWAEGTGSLSSGRAHKQFFMPPAGYFSAIVAIVGPRWKPGVLSQNSSSVLALSAHMYAGGGVRLIMENMTLRPFSMVRMFDLPARCRLDPELGRYLLQGTSCIEQEAVNGCNAS